MSRSTAPKHEIVIMLHLDVNKAGGHYGVIAAPKYIGEDGALHNGVGTLINGWDLYDLEIRAWYSTEFPELNYGRMFDTICYRGIYELGLSSALSKAKTLTRLSAIFEKIEHPATFGDYVALVARKLGAKRFFVPTRPATFMHDAEPMELTLDEAKIWLNSKGEILPEAKS